MRAWTLLALTAAVATAAPVFAAQEYAIGAKVVKNNLILEPHYLTGIEMDPMPKGMAMGPDAVHLEIDIHADKGEPHGFAEGAWLPYATVHYAIEKVGGAFKASGELLPMTANDGPHYANNLKMDGPGTYHLTYTIEPPSKAGFIRHVDKATGVPAWWAPFSVDWTFAYPAKKSAD